MARSTLVTLPVFLLAVSASAAAQDFGTQWIDRVTHQLLDDDTRLTPSPLDVQLSAGEVYAYDSNIFLTHSNHTSDSIFTTFGQVILKYAQPNFDAEGDLLANYNAYASTSDASTDEERFFGRVRYHGPTIGLQLAEVDRRESSPTDAVFTNRAQRFLSNTTPEATFRLNDVASAELQSNLQYVHYQNAAFQTADNLNSRSVGTFAYRTKVNDLEALVQVGYLTINYLDTDAPPNALGYFGRLGMRGELAPNLHLIALAGAAMTRSDREPVTEERRRLHTVDAELHVAYTATEVLTAYADYSRRFGFAGGDASFQIVDSAGGTAEYALREDLKVFGRIQYDRVHTLAGDRRAYYSAAVGPEYELMERIHLEARATYRFGVFPGSQGLGSFKDAILSVGIVVIF